MNIHCLKGQHYASRIPNRPAMIETIWGNEGTHSELPVKSIVEMPLVVGVMAILFRQFAS